jgi:hypothetical protein
MKPTIFALVALAIGIGIGLAITRQEFARDVLPLGAVPATNPGGFSQLPSGPDVPHAVVVNGERYDFGSMNRGTTGEHTFVVRNDGTAPLRLATGKSTCKCTEFTLDRREIAPQETAQVHLTWKPESVDLQFEQSAELICENDAVRPLIALTIFGRVIDIVRPERWEILLSDVSANEPTHTRLKIFAYKNDKLAIDKHEWLHPAHGGKFRVRFEPLSAEEIAAEPDATAGVAVLLDVDQGLPLGPLNETLCLTTNLAEVQPLEIRVRGNVASDISLAGPRVVPEKLLVNLGVVTQATGLKTTVYLLVKGPFRNDTQLTLAHHEPAGEFTAELGEPDHTNPRVVRYPLALAIPAGTTPVARASEGGYATVKLAATHPQTKDVNLKIRYIVKE